MVPIFCTSCSEMIAKCHGLVGSRGVCELNVCLELSALTGDVISRTAFGSNYREGKRIFDLQKKQVDLILKPSRLPYMPGFRFLPTRRNWLRYKLNKEVNSMLRALIHKKETAMKSDGFGHDLLGLMLRSNEQAHKSGNGRESKGLTIKEVIEECKLFYFAGHETTSALITWTMVLLSMCPNWQDRARKEVQEVCGSVTLPDYESISQLKIVDMILHEVLRLYPTAIAQYRHVTNKTKLGEISLPRGVDLVLPTLIIHHDPKVWGGDADEFNPERFSEGVLKATNYQLSYFPFGWDPIFCIGQNFAMIEAKIALSMILQHFSFELSPSYVHSPVSCVTLQPQFGAPIILHQL